MGRPIWLILILKYLWKSRKGFNGKKQIISKEKYYKRWFNFPILAVPSCETFDVVLETKLTLGCQKFICAFRNYLHILNKYI